MNLDQVEKIAEAVLYEGYMLYPYRPSSVKNQQRWNFGVLCPRSYCEKQQGSPTGARNPMRKRRPITLPSTTWIFIP